MSAFKIQTSQADPGQFQLSGQLGYENAADMAVQGKTLFGDLQQSIILDFTAVERVDTAGIAVILSWTRLVQENHQSLTIKGLPAQAMALIQNSGLAKLLPIQ